MDQKIKMLFIKEMKMASKYMKQIFNFACNQRKEKHIKMPFSPIILEKEK